MRLKPLPVDFLQPLVFLNLLSRGLKKSEELLKVTLQIKYS